MMFWQGGRVGSVKTQKTITLITTNLAQLWRQVKEYLNVNSWWGNPREFESRPCHILFFGLLLLFSLSLQELLDDSLVSCLR